MPLSTLINEHVNSVFMNAEHFATSLFRYVDGDDGNARPITGIVTIQPAEQDDMRGRGYVHRGEILLQEDVKITATDAIKYDNNRYEVVTVGDAEHGMRTVQIQRYQPESQGVRPLKTGDH